VEEWGTSLGHMHYSVLVKIVIYMVGMLGIGTGFAGNLVWDLRFTCGKLVRVRLDQETLP
jgi:hypothetical protein